MNGNRMTTQFLKIEESGKIKYSSSVSIPSEQVLKVEDKKVAVN